MTFENFVAKSHAIFESFPNEKVWLQGGFVPNRQLHKHEAGYCIVLRYDKKTTNTISHFMKKVQDILPPTVEYHEGSFHTTVGVFGKGDMKGFVSDATVLKSLVESVEKGIKDCPENPYVEFGKWLFNDEAILVSGYPNHDLWRLSQNIRDACQENGTPIEMGPILHVTTARFISSVTLRAFEQFMLVMKSAPAIGRTRPTAIDLATWRCDGLTFDLATHRHYPL